MKILQFPEDPPIQVGFHVEQANFTIGKSQ